MTGTHHGPWAGMEPTGKAMDVPLCCIFDFEGEGLVCERVYFDFAMLQRQLGAA
jgi:predicted ester cyclase